MMILQAPLAPQPADRFVPAAKLDSLQAVRAIAAIMVVLFHLHVYTIPVVMDTPGALWAGFGMGYAGVEIFFVLSGFIMLLVHRHQFGQPRFARAFMSRRIERIYPLLWIVLIALITLRYLAGQGWPTMGETIRAFTLWPTAGEPILEPSWSLTFEMLFYAVFALCIVNLRLGQIVAGAWFTSCFVAAILDYQGWGTSLLLSPYNILFLFGMLAALAFRSFSLPRARVSVAVGTALYLLIGLGEVYGVLLLDKGMRTIGYGVAATAIIGGLAALDVAGRIRTPKVLLILGDASYAIYLVHVMAMTVLVRVLDLVWQGFPANVQLTALILLIGALISGMLAHFVLERPLLRLFRARRLQSA